MPYVKPGTRRSFIESRARQIVHEPSGAHLAGELNLAVTSIIDEWLCMHKRVGYFEINEAIGVLECAKLELYRRIAAPYEDGKKEENGDVYKANQG